MFKIIFDFQEIQLSRNKLTSLDGFSFLSSPTKKRLNSTVKRINLLDNHLTEMPVPVAQVFLIFSKDNYFK